MAAVMKLDGYAAKINASWRKTTDAVLETAQLCAEANKMLRMGDKPDFFKKLDFGSATFSKLVKIGDQPRLYEKPITALLPSSYSILYEVAQLSTSDLDAAIKDRIISPTMSRAALLSWIAEREGRAPDVDHSPKVLATLKVPLDYDNEKQEALQKALEELRAKYGFELEQPRDPQAEALRRILKRVDHQIRKDAKSFIREVKAARLARDEPWQFSDDELNIPDDADWLAVEDVLTRIDAKDQYYRVRDGALRAHGLSAEFVADHRDLDQETVIRRLKEMDEVMARLPDERRRIPKEKFADWK